MVPRTRRILHSKPFDGSVENTLIPGTRGLDIEECSSSHSPHHAGNIKDLELEATEEKII